MLLVLFNPIDRALSGATTPGNEGVLHIPQSPGITGTSPSDCLVSYPGHSLGVGAYPSAEVQSVYSTAPANWAKLLFLEMADNDINNKGELLIVFRRVHKISFVLKICKKNENIFEMI